MTKMPVQKNVSANNQKYTVCEIDTENFRGIFFSLEFD